MRMRCVRFMPRRCGRDGADAGAPGPRQAAMTVYYAAFVQDPDGNKLEAATFPRKA